MKRSQVFLLALCFLLFLAGCGKSPADQADAGIADSLSLLDTVWASYSEDEKFPAGGGDYETEETTAMDAPGRFRTTDTAVWDYTLAVPETVVNRTDDAASLVHMMNANIFTCSVVHVKDSSEADSAAAEMKENISSRQWMCGQPDKMLIMRLGGYVISAFGEQSVMDTFKEKVLQNYPAADVLTEEAVIE